MNRKKYLFIIFILFFLVGCQAKPPVNLSESTDQPTVKFNSVLLKVELAKTHEEQLIGLSGRTELCQNCGMLFIFPSYQVGSFWMNEMKFPLDIIWLKDNEILGFSENIPILTNGHYTTVNSSYFVNKVLEVNAGWVKANNVKVGDKVEYLNID